jgi:signal transduction histidine kinase
MFVMVIFIIIISLFFIWSQQLSQNARAEGEQKLHLGLAEHLVQDNPLLQQGVYDKAALENLFHTLMILGPSFEFYYLDPQGKILTYSAETGKVKRQSVDLIPILELLQDPEQLPKYGDDPRNNNGKKIFSVFPIYSNTDKDNTLTGQKFTTSESNLQGYLYVIIGGEIYDTVFAQLENNQTLKASLFILLAATLFLLLVAVALIKYLTQPLTQLSQSVSQIDMTVDNGLPAHLQLSSATSSNEIDKLAFAFKTMAERISLQVEQLHTLDTHRRELLADLSHDLRTPLASLQGYIETIALKGDDLSTDERQHFIEVSLKNAQALRRLIDQIFELAYLEGGQVKVSFETLPLGELLHDVVAKFIMLAQQKNIQIKVNPEQFNYQVYTDIAKLERILSNIIDNALRHTPEGGSIEINVASIDDSSSSNKLKIEIKDSGVGISEQDIAYIFDARYRASNSQGKNGKNAGLGLAITKKLVNLLNSDISVSSQLGLGTSFIFYLTTA